MKNILLFLLFSLLYVKATAQTEKLSFDNGWRFYLGDIPMPVIKGHDISYNNAKAGKAWGAADAKFKGRPGRISRNETERINL